MSDLEKYIAKRKKTDEQFAECFEEGYRSFKIGLILRQAREFTGLTREESDGIDQAPAETNRKFPNLMQ